MDKDMIEKMKKNRVQWNLLTKEEQAALKDAGGENTLYYGGEAWVRMVFSDFEDYPSLIYRIKSDYEPPEIEKCPVKPYQGQLCYTRHDITIHFGISEAVDDPNFIGFWYEEPSTGIGLGSMPRIVVRNEAYLSAYTPKEVWFKC